MSEEQLEQLAGKAKEVVGKVVDDKSLEAEGAVESLLGKAKELANDAVDSVKGAVEGVKNSFDKK